MQARIGGIVANNASGMCCGVAGNSYHTMHSIRVILSDGTVLDTGDEQSKVRGWPGFLAANHFHVSTSRWAACTLTLEAGRHSVSSPSCRPAPIH
jgi:hypothetical protein